jgi:aconitate decarboxylase
MRLDVPAMQHAIGIAATQVTGLREMFGSHTKPFHPGRAAQNGLLSAVLASGGYTSSLKALEAERGWANVVSTSDQLLYQINSLGETWEILQNTFKPFPCGLVNHPIIDACIRLHQELVKVGVEISEIVSISAKVHPLVLELTGNRNPKDGLQAKFSVFHSGSISLALGKAGLAQYLDLAVQDPVIIEVRDKMDAVADETITPDEAIVILVLRDGRQFKKHITHAVGCVEVPMTDGQLEEKFKDQTLLVYKDPKMVDRASEACWAIESANDVAAVAELL